jgi:hypothetical protein
MRFEGRQRRTALATGNLSLVLCAIVLGLTLVSTVFFSQVTSFIPTNANADSKPNGSPAVSRSGSPANQPAVPSAASYPLVFAPNSPKTCEEAQFCVNATLGFSGQTATNIPPATTVTGSNGTTIVHGSTTTIIRGNATTEKFPDLYSSYSVYVTALVQDAVTGQNVTTSSGSSVITDLCYIQPTGFTHCYVVGQVPGAHTLKVTVFVTTPDGKTILAPPSPPVTVAE